MARSTADLCPPEFHMPAGMDYGGFVMPYADSPPDGENVGESVYLDILGVHAGMCTSRPCISDSR